MLKWVFLSDWSALRPGEIVYGGESVPCAVRSLLRWYMNGPLYTPWQSSILTCNRIHLNQQDTASPRGYVVSQRMVKEQITPQAVKQISELDFSNKEREYQCRAKTSSSMRWWKLVPFTSRTCTIKCPSHFVIPENIHTLPWGVLPIRPPPPHPLGISVPEGSCITPLPPQEFPIFLFMVLICHI